MRAIKAIISWSLIIILIFSASVCAFAYDSINAKLDRLCDLCNYAVDTYGCSAKHNSDFVADSSTEYLKLRKGVYNITTALTDCAYLLTECGYLSGKVDATVVSAGQVDNLCDTLIDAMDTARVTKQELSILLDFCMGETNDISYYDDDLYSDFLELIDRAKALCENTDATADDINTTYFDLLYQFNLLCSSNTLYGDMDNNSVINVVDATRLQRILADFDQINTSQKLICDLNITYVTAIQMYLVHFTDSVPVPDTALPDILSNCHKADIDSDDFDFSSWRLNPYFEQYRIEHTYSDALIDYAQLVSSAQTEGSLTLAIMSDTHYAYDNELAKQKIETSSAMGRLADYIELDAMANLGDMVVGNEQKDITLRNLNEIIDNTNKNAQCPVLYARGNHDDNGWYSYIGEGTKKPDEIINDSEWAQLAFGTQYQSGVVTDPNNFDGGYGYLDDEDSKIRVFVLNSVDIPYVLEDNGSYRYDSYECYAFSNEQLNFVADALKFDDKPDKEQWAAMFLMHVPLDTTNDDGYRFGGSDSLIRGYNQMLSIITAYKNGSTASYKGSVYDSARPDLEEDFYVEYSVDYSSNGFGEVIGFVSGHTHADNMSKRVGYENSLSFGYSYIGVVGSNAFATLVVDRAQSKISVFKYGKPIRETNTGSINGEEELSIDIMSRQYSLYYDQLVPQGENLYTGVALEDTRLLYKYEDKTNGFNSETYIPYAVEEDAGFATSYVIAVKPLTTYILPREFVGKVAAYRRPVLFSSSDKQYMRAGRQADIVIKQGDNYCTVTTDELTSYIAIGFDKVNYPDYSDFYLKEMYCEIK